MDLQHLIDRTHLEDVLYQYYDAVDAYEIEPLVDAFAPDAVFDVSDLGLKSYKGHDEIGGFFKQVFSGVEYHVHHITNFHVTELSGDTGKARAYVFAQAKAADGEPTNVHCSIDIDYVNTAQGWKMSNFDEDFIVPMGDEIAEMHNMA